MLMYDTYMAVYLCLPDGATLRSQYFHLSRGSTVASNFVLDPRAQAVSDANSSQFVIRRDSTGPKSRKQHRRGGAPSIPPCRVDVGFRADCDIRTGGLLILILSVYIYKTNRETRVRCCQIADSDYGS